MGPDYGICIFAPHWADLNLQGAGAGRIFRAMEREAAGSHTSVTAEGASEYLTPTKSFSKKRVTAGAEIVGAVHCSPEANLTRAKGIVQSERSAGDESVTCGTLHGAGIQGGRCVPDADIQPESRPDRRAGNLEWQR